MIQNNQTPKPGDSVEVYASGSCYSGILIGMTESEVYLKSATRTWVIPMDRVQSVRKQQINKKKLRF